MHLWESGYGVPVEMIRLVSAWVLVNGLLMKPVWRTAPTFPCT